MAFAGKSERKENVTAAIAANIWMSNERGAKNAFPEETLNFIVLDCLVCVCVCVHACESINCSIYYCSIYTVLSGLTGRESCH